MPGATPALARRYAEALYDVLEANQREGALRVLQQVAKAWHSSRELRRFVAAPMVPVEVRVAALAEAAGVPIGHPIDMLLGMILARRRNELLSILPDAFEAVIDEHEGRRRVIIHAAVRPTDAELERLRSVAERIAGGEVNVQVRIDPALLGGVRLQCGDRILDATLKSFLRQLAQRLIETPISAEALES